MKKILLIVLISFVFNLSFAKYIALTFDDGPNNIYTPKVLEILKQNNVKATFFVLGKNAQAFSGVLKNQFLAGHEIGNHSYSHPYFTKIGDQKALEEIEKTNQIIEKIIGQKPRFFRPPYGLWNEFLIKKTHQKLAMRNIEGMDRNIKTATGIKNQILKNAKNGGIILVHDIHPQTIQALDDIIKDLKSQGYEFLTLSQLEKFSPTSLDPANAKYIPENEKKFVKLPSWFRILSLCS